PHRSLPSFPTRRSSDLGFDTALTNVLKDDIFEPNDSVPSLIDLDQGGPWPGTLLAPILFTNPALAFEPVDRATLGMDWFRFSTRDRKSTRLNSSHDQIS